MAGGERGPRRRSSADGLRRDPRPAALLGAASLTAAGTAILLLAGTLDAAGRAGFGALVVAAATATRTRPAAGAVARMGPALTSAVRLALGIGGAAILVGGLVALVDDAALERGGPSPLGSFVLLAVPALLLLGRGAAGDRAARLGGGVMLALAISALLDGAGLQLLPWAILLVASAAGGTGIVLVARGSVARDVLGAHAATSLALVVGGGAGLTGLVAGFLPGAQLQPDGIVGSTAQAILTAVALAVALALAAAAAAHRDLAGGLLAGSVLLATRVADVTSTRVGLLLVPGVVVVGGSLLLLRARTRSRGGRDARTPGAEEDEARRRTPWAFDGAADPGAAAGRLPDRDAVAAAVAGALVVVALALESALGEPGRGAGVAALALLGIAAIVGARGRGTASVVAATAVLVGLAPTVPWRSVVGGASDGGDHAALAGAIGLAVVAAVAVVLARRVRHPAVAGAAVWALAPAVGDLVLRALPEATAQERAWVLATTIGPPVLVAVAAGALALAGRPGVVRHAQAAGAVALVVAGLAAFAAATNVVSAVAVGSGDVVDRVGPAARTVGTVATVALLLGAALLAASTARRTAGALAAAIAPATIGAACLLAALGSSLDAATGAPPPVFAVGRLEAADLVLGLAPAGVDAGRAGSVWPALLALLALSLALAAVALERLRPPPAGASMR